MDPSYVYQSLANRRVGYDQLMWQVPAIALAAQAVLVAASINDELRKEPRLILLALALLVGALSLQLFAKQRFHEQVDTRYLARWEQGIQMWPVDGLTPHDHATRATGDSGTSKVEQLGVRRGALARLPSFLLWFVGLLLFNLGIGALLVLTVTGTLFG